LLVLPGALAFHGIVLYFSRAASSSFFWAGELRSTHQMQLLEKSGRSEWWMSSDRPEYLIIPCAEQQ